MRVVIAPDSFKECLRADEVAAAIEAGWLAGMPQSKTQCFPMADGGEGTVDAVVRATGGERVSLRVSGPLGEAVEAHYGLIQEGKVAVLEMAAASGLTLVREADRDPCRTSTYGTGELFVHALDRGVEDIIIGVGGSATNDGGAGMAQALDFKLLDKHGAELERGGARLIQLDSIDASDHHPRLSEINVYVACDVNNPLCGPNGASAVYGPQKGASSEDVLILDHALAHFAKIIKRDLGVELEGTSGAGAAGGLAGGASGFYRRQAGERPRIDRHLVQSSAGYRRCRFGDHRRREPGRTKLFWQDTRWLGAPGRASWCSGACSVRPRSAGSRRPVGAWDYCYLSDKPRSTIAGRCPGICCGEPAFHGRAGGTDLEFGH
jgi:glycerate 2-kinase